MEAEKLKKKQQVTEINFDKKTALKNLASLTYSIIDESLYLKPKTITELNVENNRPEMKLFDLQNEQINLSKDTCKSNLPKVNAFGLLVMEIGLNMLDNSFQAFYMFGVKANWNLFDWNKSKNRIAEHYPFRKLLLQKKKLLYSTLVCNYRKWKMK
jgi:hypothetical protein